jgi:hypothetical protein
VPKNYSRERFQVHSAFQYPLLKKIFVSEAQIKPNDVKPGRETRRGNAAARHCERSEAIQNASVVTVGIASSLALLAMTV